MVLTSAEERCLVYQKKDVRDEAAKQEEVFMDAGCGEGDIQIQWYLHI